jgi:hypothetical protein
VNAYRVEEAEGKQAGAQGPDKYGRPAADLV